MNGDLRPILAANPEPRGGGNRAVPGPGIASPSRLGIGPADAMMASEGTEEGTMAHGRCLRNVLGAAAILAAAGLAAADLPPLVPRGALFGNPVREFPAISPDGARLAYLAPDAKGGRQVWVGGADGADARPVTRDPHRGVEIHRWAGDSRHVLDEQDSDGDEN